MSTSREQRLPAGWAAATLGDLAEYLNGVAFKPSDWGDEGVPIIRIQNLTNPSKPLNLTKREVNPRLLVHNGDLLFSWSATIDAFLWKGQDAWLNQHIFKVECEQEIPRKFLYYLLRHVTREIVSSEHIHGSTMQHINRGPFLRHTAQLPPCLEQERIVEALDELFSDLEFGVAALERAQKRLKHYRGSVLKAAVEGSLTAVWRATHQNVEPASELLRCILAERRRRWEEDQLRKFREKRKSPPKNWKAKYTEPSAPDTADLPPLPDGWCWATLAQLVWAAGYGTSVKCREENHGLPVLRIPNIVDGRISLDDLKCAPGEYEECKYKLVSEGDLLVVRTNGSRTLIGRGAVIRENQERPLSFASYLIRLRLVKDCTLLSWVALLWDSPYVRDWIEIHAATSAGQYNISLRVLKTLVVPIPPRREQKSIVEVVEDQLSTVDHLEADLSAKLKAAQGLKQTILHHAFSGRLVPQDPNEEPASELLKRVAAERKARSRQAAASTLAARNTDSRTSGRRDRPRKAAVEVPS